MIIIPNLKILSKSFNSSDVDENILITYTICAVCATFLSLLICKKKLYYILLLLLYNTRNKNRKKKETKTQTGFLIWSSDPSVLILSQNPAASFSA